MKISELPRIDEARRDAEIPVASEGENFNITIGQIVDSASSIVRFDSVVNEIDSAIVNGAPPSGATVESVTYEEQSQGFYCLASDGDASGYYNDWSGREDFYDADGNIRRDRLFLASDGHLYFFNGQTLKLIGGEEIPDTTISYEDMVNMTSAQAIQYALSKKASRLTVTKTGVLELINVGTLDLISDDSALVVTQFFTTHYTEPQSDGTFSAHTDTKLYTYARYIGFRSTTIPKTWSEWQLHNVAKETEIVQSTGASQTAVMSQAAVTNELNTLDNKFTSLSNNISGSIGSLTQGMSAMGATISKKIPPVFNPSAYWSDNPTTWTLPDLLDEIEDTSALSYLKVPGTIITFQTDGGNWVQYQFNPGEPPVTSEQIAQRFASTSYWKQVGEIPDSFGGGYVYPERYSSDFYTGFLLALEVSRTLRRPTIDCTYFTGAQTFEDTITLDFPVNILLGDVDITTKGKNFFNIEANNISIVGCNRQTDNLSTDHNATTLIMTAQYSVSNASNEGYHIYSHGMKNCQYRNMVLRGVQTSTGRQANNPQYPINGCGGIFIEKEDTSVTQAGNTANATIIENLLIDGTKASAIYIDTPILSMIRQTRVSNAGGHGVFIKDGTSTVLESVYVASAKYAGFCIYGLTYGAVINSVAENCGCGWWIRSCTDVTFLSPGVETTYNYGRNPWSASYGVTGRYGLGLTTLAPDGTVLNISDVPDEDWAMGSKRIHAKDLFLGYAFVITGGRNLNIFTPYSISIANELDPNNPKLESTKDDICEMLIMGNCRALTVTNALFQERDYSLVKSAIPYEIRISNQVSNLDLSYNPENTFLPTYTSPTPVTSDELLTAPIFSQSPSAFIHCGNKWYSKMVLADIEILGSMAVAGQIVTDTGIVTKGPIVEYDSATLNLIIRSLNPLLSTDENSPTTVMYQYAGTKVTIVCKATFALEDVSAETTFKLIANDAVLDTKVGIDAPLSATVLSEGSYELKVQAERDDKVATSQTYYLEITENPDLDVRFLSTVATAFTPTAVTLQLTFEGNRVVSEVGIAYSSNNQAPEKKHNNKSYTASELQDNLIDNGDGTYTYSIDLPRSSATQLRYVRGYVGYAGDAIPAYDSKVYKVVGDTCELLV